MNQSPPWSAQRAEPDAAAGAVPGSDDAGTRMRPKQTYRRLSLLQTAAATAVIIASLAGLAAMTGIFSLNGSDEPALLSAASTSPLRSAGGPVPRPVDMPSREPADMITRTGTATPALRFSPDLPSAAELDGDAATAKLPDTATPGDPNNPTRPGMAVTPRTVGVTPGPQIAAAKTTPPPRTLHRAAPHQDHQRRSHQGKTRDQVIEELMQAKRDGSYRTLQENYR